MSGTSQAPAIKAASSKAPVSGGRTVGQDVLHVENLRVEVRTDRGPGPVLVDNVSFDLKRGEVLGLIGESGAGKSTIGLTALGYTRGGCHMTGGKLMFGGKDIRQMSGAERRALRGPGVAYIAQSAAASFNPAMTLFEQVCEIPVKHGLMSVAEARIEAVKLFRELELPNPDTFGNRYPHQVSGGQLQRAMAAMAMAARPDILVFDEPTTALDVTTQVEVLYSFRKLIREYGTAAIYITHDLAVVAQIADHIMVLRHGKMVEVGASDQILQAPREEYTRRLVAERVAGHNFREDLDSGEKPLLEVSNVVASYHSLLRVIDNVSVQVRRGDTVAVVGESGSGKSTLARVIIGLLPRQSGDIRFAGESLPPALKNRNKDQLRRIQMIY
ncbi:MAG TPA: ATP-binding cassette domain-containing protein, partial [Bradyrhizobium sp.]